MNDSQLLGQIAEAVYNQNEKGNDSFINFSGHVNQLSISVYDGAWSDTAETVYSATRYLDRDFILKSTKSLSEILQGIVDVPETSQSHANQLNKLIENN